MSDPVPYTEIVTTTFCCTIVKENFFGGFFSRNFFRASMLEYASFQKRSHHDGFNKQTSKVVSESNFLISTHLSPFQKRHRISGPGVR